MSFLILLTNFLQKKKKVCIVRTGPKLYTCVTLLYNGTTGETDFPKLSHLGSIISTKDR